MNEFLHDIKPYINVAAFDNTKLVHILDSRSKSRIFGRFVSL